MNRKILISIGILIAVIVVFFVVKLNATGKVVDDNLNSIKIPLSEISSKAQFYEYGGIEYFAIKASDGTIKTAFNACDVCYSANKGYRQEGNYMICNNCGNKYPINGLGTENLRGGGCWPGYLPNSVEGDQLVIKESDLEKGRYRFK